MKRRPQVSLFDSFNVDNPLESPEIHEAPSSVEGWVPDTPPQLDGIRDICLNFETTGLKWWEDDRPISISLEAGGRTYYLPWRHKGGNLDEAVVKRWAQRELRNKRITNINTRFDIHMARVWGVDLEEQGNEVSDVGHYAALLDDHRHHTALDVLIPDFLHEQPMARLDESRMVEYHASLAAPRSMYNVAMVRRLKEAMWPMLDAQDLQPVRALEDQVIFVVCEMEKNGAPIDLELLDRWTYEIERKINKLLFELAAEIGHAFDPMKNDHLIGLFNKYGIPIQHTKTQTINTTTGEVSKPRPSFTNAILREIKHPIIEKVHYVRKLKSLNSKFIASTKKNVDSHGILRYALHQLRTSRDSEHAEGGEAGTVTGRFSSTELVRGFGVNVQQRMKAAKQRISFGYDEEDDTHDDEIYLVRRLHIPASGLLLASDMDQAQYRIFASYVNNPKIIEAYRQNPHLSFHKYMHAELKPYVTDFSYRDQKDLNFGVIFGAQTMKMALMMRHITQAQYEELKETRNYSSPLLDRTKKVQDIYNREIPEVSDLLAKSAHLGKPQCDARCRKNDKLHRSGLPHRGYVKTVMGRRMRFPDGQRLHKAFNGVDQGTEADVMKTKLVQLHAARHKTGLLLRITNHDEIVGDIGSYEGAMMVDELLNRQDFPDRLLVPLTWSTEVGKNWADTDKPTESMFEKGGK